MSWTLGAESVASVLGSVTLRAHALLIAETCVRSFAPLPKRNQYNGAAVSAFPDVRRGSRRAKRDVSAFLVLDMMLTCLVAMQTASLCGYIKFTDPRLATTLSFAWPAAIVNWIGRLASETSWRVFDDVAVAVARKETTAMRRATRARRLGGSPAPKGGPLPPDARRWRRVRFMWALQVEQWREAATCGSARLFRRVIALCCVVDWLVLAGTWSALGVVGGTLGGMYPTAALLPLATCLALDAARVAAQLTHARLLVAARVSSAPHGTTSEASGGTADGKPLTSPKASTLNLFPLKALPVGMTSRLTRFTYALNVWNMALTIVAGVLVGNLGVTSVHIPASFIAVTRVVACARFARLVSETAYLTSALLAVVDRPLVVDNTHAPDVSDPVTSLRLDLHDLGVDGDLAGAVAERLAAARALATRLRHGFSKDGTFQNVFPGTFGSSDKAEQTRCAFDTSTPAMTLPEFTEAISPGLRGYVVGVNAEHASAKVFSEMVVMSDGTDPDAVGLSDIQRWLAAQPSLRGSSGKPLPLTSAPGDDSSDTNSLSDVEKEIRWRRSVQRVLLRLVRRAEYGRGRRQREGVNESTGDGTVSENASIEVNATSDDPSTSTPFIPPPPKQRGLRLLSLEGGGIKGLALIWQLRALERAAGRPIHELFDLIGGVSTGGIIALGLARGVSLGELEKMYHDIGRDVFGSQSTVRRLLKGNAADNTAIRDLLVEYLGDLPMLDAENQLVKCFVVATQQTERLEVRLVRTYRHPNKGRDQNEGWRQWEAGMATSSAPTVFPPFVRENRGVVVVGDGGEGGEGKKEGYETRKETTPDKTAPRQVFIDGALSGYNNPSSLVLNEGLDLAEPGQQIDVLLSLGCGEVAGAGGNESENGDRGLVFWLGQVVNLAFDVELQEAHVASLIQRFSPQTMHVRLNPPTGGVSLTEHRPEILQRMEQDTRQYLAENRVVFADVAAALVEQRGFTKVDLAPSTPWDHPGYFAGDIGVIDDASVLLNASSDGSGGVGYGSAMGTNVDKAYSAFQDFAKKNSPREHMNVNRKQPNGASVTVRRGPGDWTRLGPRAKGGKKLNAATPMSAPVAPLDRFPSFPGPGTARSAEAAKERAEAAKAFACKQNERKGWRRFFWGRNTDPAPASANEDLGEVEEVQPEKGQVALGEVPDVDLKKDDSENEMESSESQSSVVAVVDAANRAASAVGEQLRVQSVSVKSWLDEGAEFVSGWDDEAKKNGSEDQVREKNEDEKTPNKTR